MKVSMTILMAIIIAHAMVVTAAPIGLDGNTKSQAGSRNNIITKSTLSEFRVFTTTNDKTVKARVRAYNPDKGIVTIAKENGGTLKVDLSTLSKADQAYVREWHLIKEFFTQDRFHISVRKKRSGAGAEHLIWRQEEVIVFDIMLENRSHYDLNGLTLDYRIYHGQEELNYPGQVMSQGVKSGTRNIGTLARGKKMRFETQPVVLPKEELIEYYTDNKMPQGKILGIWVRVYLPLAGGNKAMRELSSPDALIKNRKSITPEDPNSMNN